MAVQVSLPALGVKERSPLANLEQIGTTFKIASPQPVCAARAYLFARAARLCGILFD